MVIMLIGNKSDLEHRRQVNLCSRLPFFVSLGWPSLSSSALMIRSAGKRERCSPWKIS
jgi:hypothetical protein